MRLKPAVASLRTRQAFAKFRACAKRAQIHGLFINEFSLLGNHLHLIAEAKCEANLARAMRSFGGALGKAIRARTGGRGGVFRGRYHLHVLRSPREYRHALKYVLLNHSQHAGRPPAVDRFSSSPHFGHWNALLGKLPVGQFLARADAEHLAPARSWLGRVGWRR